MELYQHCQKSYFANLSSGPLLLVNLVISSSMSWGVTVRYSAALRFSLLFGILKANKEQ